MKTTLPPDICSIEDLEALIFELQNYASWYTHNSIKQTVNAKSAARPPVLSQSALLMLRGIVSGGLLTQAHLDTLIDQLVSYKNQAPTMTITLAAPAGQQLKARLTGWCRDTIDANMLVSFRFNSTILGGMVVQYGSRIFDWSFRRAIHTKRSAFPEVLRRV